MMAERDALSCWPVTIVPESKLAFWYTQDMLRYATVKAGLR